MTAPGTYERTRARVETYFDQTATKTWERLTSDAPVSGVRATVRAGRDQMRSLMLAQIPEDLQGARVLDAGCGTGAMSALLAERGADVVGIDISPALIKIASKRNPDPRITFCSGDMFDAGLGTFDYGLAMDSMIYYSAEDLGHVLAGFAPRLRHKLVFTLPPRTALLMAMWRIGKLFPKKDRSPSMVPHCPKGVAKAAASAGALGDLREIGTVNSGFYHSSALSFETHGRGGAQ